MEAVQGAGNGDEHETNMGTKLGIVLGIGVDLWMGIWWLWRAEHGIGMRMEKKWIWR